VYPRQKEHVMTQTRSILAALVLLAPLAARAANVPVTYTVDEKQLKAAVAGTTLTFILYNDAACTSQVYSGGVLIENVTILARLKQFTPKNSPKRPKTVALEHTLVGVTSVANLYLQVTGTGVVPVGGACQAQGVLVAVASCSDGVQDQGETDVDCGGLTSCPRCAVGENCSAGSDCQTSSCMGGQCVAASCTDTIKNGNETGIDCGGGTCPTCGPGQGCLAGSDCTSNICNMGMCN
jgi:hypothetical protein